jgi:diguanylate cyclase (GGDEF)-like protein
MTAIAAPLPDAASHGTADLRLKGALASLTVQAKLRLITAVVSLGLLVVGIVSEVALARIQSVTEDVVRRAAALSLLQTADMAHDALRATVYATLLVGQATEVSADAVRKDARLHTKSLRESLSAMAAIDLGADLHAQLSEGQEGAEKYLDAVETTLSAALLNPRAAHASLPAFHAAFQSQSVIFEKETHLLRALNDMVLAQRDAVKTQAIITVVVAALLTLTLTLLLVSWIGRSIRTSLQRVQCVATAVASGDMGRRADTAIDDEVGRLARAVNGMSDKLQQMLAGAVADSARHTFSNELNDALDMADSEPEAYLVVQRAMASVAPDRPMELLVSDSSQAVLQRATEHPVAGAPGCGVEAPFSCQAVRRGNSISFADSEALNACPRLRGRPGQEGALSAVCVPLHFMGRALGVLHSTGPAHQAMNARQLEQFKAVGAQAAARLGVVRAFQRTQLQAATDSATGLPNRRAFEAATRELVRKKQPFALLMADLDKFKILNDTYGHLVGDEALRVFSDTMKSCMRDQDLVARWGGEEFAVLLDGANAEQACAWADRSRSRLSAALQGSKVPKFTVSFGVSDSTMSQRPEELMRIADEALYVAKDQGRDRAMVGHVLAANEPLTRHGSEHEGRIDLAQLNPGA